MKGKEATDKEILVTKLSTKIKNIVMDISHNRKKKKAHNSTIADVVEELITLGLAHSKPEIPTA
jgi:hypothetical protein